MKAEEPMVFYDHLIFSLVFSKLRGSSIPEWLCTNKNRNKQKKRHHDPLNFIQHCHCLCYCKVLGPQLSSTSCWDLKRKKYLNHWMSSSCGVGFQQVVRTRLNPSLKWALKQVNLNIDCSQTKTETHSRDQRRGSYLYSRWFEMQQLCRRSWKVHNRSKTRESREGMW